MRWRLRSIWPERFPPRRRGRQDEADGDRYLDLISDLSLWVTAIATAVLAVATTVLAWSTWRYAKAADATVLEMQQSHRPALHLSPEILGVNFPIARLTNAGTSAALDVYGNVHVDQSGTRVRSHEIAFALLGVNDFREFMIERDEHEQIDAQTVARQGRTFGVELTYRDASGRTYELRQTIDWLDIVQHLWQAHIRRTFDQTEELIRHVTKIHEALENVRSALERPRTN